MATRPANPLKVNIASKPRGMEEVKGLASPRTGRPIVGSKPAPSKLGSPVENDKDDFQTAFGVPETPPTRKKNLLLSKTPAALEPPFPLANDETARHIICTDSLMPWTYLLQLPGKNVRDVLIDAFDHWLQCSEEHLVVIKQVVGYLHTASLIIDDIEDESATRRGEKAAHIVYGTARALNAGNYVYFLALEKLLTVQSPECVQIFTSEMLNLHRGQGRDILWRTNAYLATEDEYCQMVCDKTGGLFRLAIRIMQALSSNAEERMLKKLSAVSFDEEPNSPTERRMRTASSFIFSQTSDFTVLANDLACYFQIRDDLLNLASPKFHEKKGFCEDITEGKLSFIALHSLRSYQETKRLKEKDMLLSILQSKTTDRSEIREALRLMDATGSFTYTLDYLSRLLSDVHTSIAAIGENKLLSKLVKTLAADLDDCYDIRTRVINATY